MCRLFLVDDDLVDAITFELLVSHLEVVFQVGINPTYLFRDFNIPDGDTTI